MKIKAVVVMLMFALSLASCAKVGSKTDSSDSVKVNGVDSVKVDSVKVDSISVDSL